MNSNSSSVLSIGYGLQTINFTVGYSEYIYIPGLHTDPNKYCGVRFGGQLAHVESEHELELISQHLKQIRQSGIKVAGEVWIGGNTLMPSGSRVNITDVFYGESYKALDIISSLNTSGQIEVP